MPRNARTVRGPEGLPRTRLAAPQEAPNEVRSLAGLARRPEYRSAVLAPNLQPGRQIIGMLDGRNDAKAITHPTDAEVDAPGAVRSWSSSPGAIGSSCARAIGGWPSEPPSWSGATAMPISSSAPVETLEVPAHAPGARHPGYQPQDRWQRRPGGALQAAADPGRPGAASRIIASAVRRSMPCMRRRSSASARARLATP